MCTEYFTGTAIRGTTRENNSRSGKYCSNWHSMTIQTRTILLSSVALFTLLATGCASHQRAYSPQDPTASSRQKPGQKPYTIAGKRYEPLSSHEGFVQEGIASSYGLDFHGRKTSNGETFDMNAMTAAHKTLPLGVYVKVRHKRNGREIVVRINDRGPFVGDRIIDLSEGAARKLDMIQEGLAPVTVVALGYKVDRTGGEAEYRAPVSYDSGRFALQVAAYKNRTNAYRYADELKTKYGAADVQEAMVKGSMFYRVRVGRYPSLHTAQTGQEQFEKKGFTGNFVVAVD